MSDFPTFETLLYDEPRLASGELFLIGHSLGGLIIKMMLRDADIAEKSSANAKSFLRRVRKVAFLATPHTGADLGRVANWLRVIARPTEETGALSDNDPNLRTLTQDYRKIAANQNIDHLILTEREPLTVLYRPRQVLLLSQRVLPEGPPLVGDFLWLRGLRLR